MLYGDHPQLSGILQRIIVMTPLFYKDSLPALCRGGMVLWSAKVPKALCQSSYGPFTLPHTHQKNNGTAFCVQNSFKN